MDEYIICKWLLAHLRGVTGVTDQDISSENVERTCLRQHKDMTEMEIPGKIDVDQIIGVDS